MSGTSADTLHVAVRQGMGILSKGGVLWTDGRSGYL
jgi:hypothetical protein